METLTLNVTETAKRLGLGRNRTYRLLRLGRIPSVRAGRRFRIPAEVLPELLRDPARLNIESEEGARDQRTGDVAGRRLPWRVRGRPAGQ